MFWVCHFYDFLHTFFVAPLSYSTLSFMLCSNSHGNLDQISLIQTARATQTMTTATLFSFIFYYRARASPISCVCCHSLNDMWCCCDGWNVNDSRIEMFQLVKKRQEAQFSFLLYDSTEIKVYFCRIFFLILLISSGSWKTHFIYIFSSNVPDLAMTTLR